MLLLTVICQFSCFSIRGSTIILCIYRRYCKKNLCKPYLFDIFYLTDLRKNNIYKCARDHETTQPTNNPHQCGTCFYRTGVKRYHVFYHSTDKLSIDTT